MDDGAAVVGLAFVAAAFVGAMLILTALGQALNASDVGRLLGL